MVKLGFIGEGAVEKIILESSQFQEYLHSLGIDFVNEVVDATGNGNLLPHNIDQYSQILKSKGASTIIILTDLDDDQCTTLTKSRIKPSEIHIVIVSVKEIEAWFLADEEAMRTFLKDNDYSIGNPEAIEKPFEKIRGLRIEKIGRGIGSKVILANQMINKHNFSILRAAKHPNCASARFFIGKIIELSQKQSLT